MKAFATPVLLFFVSLTAFADTDSILRDCRFTCSLQCLSFAEDVQNAVNAVIENCQGSSTQADVINACASSFGNGQSGSQCVQGASSADVVSMCASRFGNGQSGLECALNARSEDVVQACATSFGNGQSGLRCAQEASSGSAVTACASKFGNGSTGLNCATGN